MSYSLFRFLLCIFLFILLFSESSCVGGKHLKAKNLEGTEQFTGLFHVILYGRKHHDDLLTVAILDRAGDDYELVPHEPVFEYTVERNIRGNAAVEKATHFVSYHRIFHSSRSRKILDFDGNIIAYDIRPLYMPFVYGMTDVIEVDYWLLEEGKVKVTIRFSVTAEEEHHLLGVD